MRYMTFATALNPQPRLGGLMGDTLVEVGGLAPGFPSALLELIQRGPEAERQVRAAVERQGRTGPAALPASDARWHAPIPRPPKHVICLGLNYLAHARESARARGKEIEVPQVPVFFTKAPTAINGPFADVVMDAAVTSQLDWEVELAVVIGTPGRDIPRADALRHVFGYTVVNDLSARDLQMRHLQWFKGKSLDGCCPMGPVVVTADEFGDPQRKRLRLRVNGETMQDSTTADMIFPVDAIIESLSRGMTLEAGDVIATGTPEGVGMGRTPPRFLSDGDVVETEIEGIGTLRNRIVRRGA
jgi:2-keto-4-pentenoate hydratase/2-oxohepta-3-ene-1,7-dioic acid hydratase in catechol pathway